MRQIIFASLALSLSATVLSCKKKAGTSSSSGLSSVSIALPKSVQGVSQAKLVTNTSNWVSSGRTFTVQVSSGGSDGSRTISFQRDEKNDALKIGEDLGQVRLDLLSGGKVIYSGVGDENPFQIQAGANKISFNLECKDQKVCPDGSTLKVIPVNGTTGEPGATPVIEAEVNVRSGGMTAGERRQLLQDCKTEVAKKTSCNQWEAEVKGGQNLCNLIANADPRTVPESSIGTHTTLDGYLKYCEDLGVVETQHLIPKN